MTNQKARSGRPRILNKEESVMLLVTIPKDLYTIFVNECTKEDRYPAQQVRHMIIKWIRSIQEDQ